MKVHIKKIDLQFLTPGQTSRGILYSKPSWLLILEENGNKGVGECSVIPGLNPEYDENYEPRIDDIVANINNGMLPSLSELDSFPSIQFGLETALMNLKQKEEGILFPSRFTKGEAGIPINGLIWMGNKTEMQSRIKEKLQDGYKVLKLKVGALDFDIETSLLKSIRSKYGPSELEIRLDANGAFPLDNAIEKLNILSEFNIHSIEQPIKAGNWEQMAEICATSPLPIALDEELIGIISPLEKKKLLQTVRPQFIILKPSLIGGLQKSKEWIDVATQYNIGWWATSALESNVGLNAIAQWVYKLDTHMVQGLGTGQVFSNNLPSPLKLAGSNLFYDPSMIWKIS